MIQGRLCLFAFALVRSASSHASCVGFAPPPKGPAAPVADSDHEIRGKRLAKYREG